MLPFALWEGAVGRGREGRGRSGPRNVFGVGAGGLAPWGPKESVCVSWNRVLLGSLLAVPCHRDGASETDIPLFMPPLVCPSLYPSLLTSFLPFTHSPFYPSVFLSSSLIPSLHSRLVLATPLKVHLLLPASPPFSLSPSPDLTHLHIFPPRSMVTTCFLRKPGKRLLGVP